MPLLWAAAGGASRRGIYVVVPSASEYDPVVHLSHGDERAENTPSPHLEIRFKTDPLRKGVFIHLGRGSCKKDNSSEEIWSCRRSFSVPALSRADAAGLI